MSVQPRRTRIPRRQDQLAEVRRERNRPHLVPVAHEPEQSEQAAETESATHASEPAMVEAAAEAPAEAEPEAVEAVQPTKSALERARTRAQQCVDRLTKYGIPLDLGAIRSGAETKALLQMLVEKGLVSEPEMAERVYILEAQYLSQVVLQVEQMRLQQAQEQRKPVVASRGGLIVPGRY